MSKLLTQALAKFLGGVIAVGALIFLPAGSFGFQQGWIFMGTLFIPIFIAGTVMLSKSPDLLRKRLNAKEKQKEQKGVVAASGILFIASFAVAGLNWRYQWSILPQWVTWCATGVFLISYLLYAEVMRENEYLSRTIEVQEGQRVIDTGLYGIVRHPMYTATILLFLSMPLILGSLYSLFIMLLYVPLIIIRIHHEEKILEASLPGYTEYQKRTKYRLIPLVW